MKFAMLLCFSYESVDEMKEFAVVEETKCPNLAQSELGKEP